MDKELKDRLDRIERIVCEINSPLDALVYFAQEVSGLTFQFQSTYLDYGKISEDFQVSPVAWREIILANIIKEWAILKAMAAEKCDDVLRLPSNMDASDINMFFSNAKGTSATKQDG